MSKLVEDKRRRPQSAPLHLMLQAELRPRELRKGINPNRELRQPLLYNLGRGRTSLSRSPSRLRVAHSGAILKVRFPSRAAPGPQRLRRNPRYRRLRKIAIARTSDNQLALQANSEKSRLLQKAQSEIYELVIHLTFQSTARQKRNRSGPLLCTIIEGPQCVRPDTLDSAQRLVNA